MLKLADGREKLYQWDTDVKVNVEIDAEYVDFRLISSYDLLRVEVKDKIAMIPNVLLQDGGAILAYANCVCHGQTTKCNVMFDVVKRPKPIDYVYTETELKKWDDLDERLKALEEREIDVDIIVDSELNSESENPVQNKVITEELSSLKSDITKETSERKAEIAVERERINQITRLEEGSTTGDAELADGRVDYKGETWDNVGDHIRGVSSQLSESIGEYEFTLTDGIYINEKGREASDSGFCASNYIRITSGMKLLTYTGANASRHAFYDADKVFISAENDSDAYGVFKTLIIPNGARYVRFSCYKNQKNLAKIKKDTIIDGIGYTQSELDSKLSKAEYLSSFDVIADSNYAKKENYYIDRTNGWVRASSTGLYDATDKIDVGNIKLVYAVVPMFNSPSNGGVAFYKSDDTYISGAEYPVSPNNGTKLCVFEIPTDAKYARFTILKSAWDQFRVYAQLEINDLEPRVVKNEQDIASISQKINSGVVVNEIVPVTSRFLNGNRATKKPLVTFIDDDGANAVYANVLPILREKNVKFSMAIITDAVDSADPYYITTKHLKECCDSGLVETLSHCHNRYTSLTSLTEEELRYQYATSKKWLLDNGFKADAFVYPQNSTNKLVRTVAMEYYDYCFTGIGFNENKYLDHSLINRIAFGSYESYNPSMDGIADKDTLEYYKACVDKAVSDGAWLIFNTHVGTETTHTTVEQMTIFSQLVDYIKSLGVDIVFPSEGFALKRNQINVGDKDSYHLFMGEDGFESNLTMHRLEMLDGRKASSSIGSYKTNIETIIPVRGYLEPNHGFPTNDGILFVMCFKGDDFRNLSYQKWIDKETSKIKMRFYDGMTSSWKEWFDVN